MSEDLEKRLAAIENRMKLMSGKQGDQRILEGTKQFLDNPDVDSATRFLREIDLAIKPGDGDAVAATVTTVTVTVTITVKAESL